MASTDTSTRLTVGSVMHREILECAGQAPLEEVARLMAEENTHSVVVHDPAQLSSAEQRVWALVTDMDLMRALEAGGLSGAASEAATGEIVTVGVHETLGRERVPTCCATPPSTDVRRL
jgi:CBS domain-containing protein